LGTTKKTVTEVTASEEAPAKPVKPVKKRRVQKYLNNGRLLEHIGLSKEIWEKAKKNAKTDRVPTAAECMTPEMVKMIMMLVERYAQRANWRGYTYIDDMKSEALLSLLNGSLKFNPEKSKNPFGYMTQIVTHSFLTTLDKEKKVRRIRDDMLERHDFDPSHTRQLENEAPMLEKRKILSNKKDGVDSIEVVGPDGETRIQYGVMEVEGYDSVFHFPQEEEEVPKGKK
jgi:DNA-directed RNA polymerase specialized sigma24 family protein